MLKPPSAALRAAIRDIPDFPKPGIVFKDITPVLADPALFAESIDLFHQALHGSRVDKIACIDARGFLFGAALAYKMGVGIIPVRKKGKLPYDATEVSYDLEYGSATLEMHVDAVAKDEHVVVVDDLLATGGTAAATCHLIEKLGGRVTRLLFLVELAFLDGRARLPGREIYAPLVF